MSRTLNSLIQTNTFEDWFIRTNEIVDTLEKVATLDNIYDNNVGDLNIIGNISATSINADNLNLGVASAVDTIALNANARVKGDLEIADDYGSGQTSALRFYNGKETDSSTPTWVIQVDPDDAIQHRRLTIGVGTGNPGAQTPMIYIDSEDGEINGQNVKIHDDLLPDNITSNITGNVTGDVAGNATTATTATYVTTLSSDVNTKLTTDLLNEGSTNLFYTNTRATNAARAAISGGGDLDYNETTGVMSYNGPTNAQVRSKISASGSLAYDETTGVISYTERSDATIRGLFSGGTGVSVSSTGKISIGQSVGTTSNVSFGTVTGSSFTTGDWTIDQSGTKLVFKYNGAVVFSISSTGAIIAEGDITSFGTA